MNKDLAREASLKSKISFKEADERARSHGNPLFDHLLAINNAAMHELRTNSPANDLELENLRKELNSIEEGSNFDELAAEQQEALKVIKEKAVKNKEPIAKKEIDLVEGLLSKGRSLLSNSDVLIISVKASAAAGAGLLGFGTDNLNRLSTIHDIIGATVTDLKAGDVEGLKDPAKAQEICDKCKAKTKGIDSKFDVTNYQDFTVAQLKTIMDELQKQTQTLSQSEASPHSLTPKAGAGTTKTVP